MRTEAVIPAYGTFVRKGMCVAAVTAAGEAARTADCGRLLHPEAAAGSARGGDTPQLSTKAGEGTPR